MENGNIEQHVAAFVNRNSSIWPTPDSRLLLPPVPAATVGILMMREMLIFHLDRVMGCLVGGRRWSGGHLMSQGTRVAAASISVSFVGF